MRSALAALTSSRSPTVTLHGLLTAWQVEPLALVALAVTVGAGIAYLVGVRRLRSRRGRVWPRWRAAAFLAGLAMIVVAVNSGLASYDGTDFAAHVVQHLLLMSVAPPLLALGAPVILALQTVGRPTKTRLLKVLHSPPVRFLGVPGVPVVVLLATMYGYFLTPLYPYSLVHPLFHDFTHLWFLAAGCVYWWPIVGADPMPRPLGYPARLGLLVPPIPFDAFLGVAIMGMSRPIAPQNSLGDTHMGGAILWGFGELFTFAALAVIFVQWAAADERRQAREDRRLDASRWAGPGKGQSQGSKETGLASGLDRGGAIAAGNGWVPD